MRMGRLGLSERKEKERGSSWVEAAAGPPTSAGLGRERGKGGFLLFYFLKSN
jgi:hypothetical protein